MGLLGGLLNDFFARREAFWSLGAWPIYDSAATYRVGEQKRDQLEEGRKLIPAGTSNGGRKMYRLTISIR
jgi:hypothetical protein